jgi:hypothetical protein
MLMPDSLDQARAVVSEMLTTGDIPQHLVGEIDLGSLVEMVSDLVQEAIKENLTPAMEEERVTEELVTNMMESVANKAALIMVQACFLELGEVRDEPDFTLSIPPDDAAGLLAGLLRGKGVTIALAVANERT